jgi:phosphoglycerate dehydrogenase-like enzyme
MKLVVHSDQPEAVLDILTSRLADEAIHYCCDYESLPAMLDRERPDVLYTIRFAGSRGFPRHAIVESPSLRWVSVGGSGTDHLSPWNPSRLTVTNAAGVAAETMAQYAVAAALSFSLGLPALAVEQRHHRWSPRPVASVKDRTVAILGLGHTGQAIAALARALGMRVTGIRARPAATANVDRVESSEYLHEILSDADFVVVCVPLTRLTRGLIDTAAFRALKPGAILIDLSRGGIVDQPALIAALRSGRLAGAALDVFETEPLPAGNPLWSMENVVITPHCSSVYDGWQRRSITMFCDNADRWRTGGQLKNIVDPQRGY